MQHYKPMYRTHKFVCSTAPAHAFRNGEFVERLLDTRADEGLRCRTRHHIPVYQPLTFVGTQGLKFTDLNTAGPREASGCCGGLPAVIVGGSESRPPPLVGLIDTLFGNLGDAYG